MGATDRPTNNAMMTYQGTYIYTNEWITLLPPSRNCCSCSLGHLKADGKIHTAHTPRHTRTHTRAHREREREAHSQAGGNADALMLSEKQMSRVSKKLR